MRAKVRISTLSLEVLWIESTFTNAISIFTSLIFYFRSVEEEAHAEAEAQKEEDEGEVQVNYTLLFYKVSFISQYLIYSLILFQEISIMVYGKDLWPLWCE